MPPCTGALSGGVAAACIWACAGSRGNRLRASPSSNASHAFSRRGRVWMGIDGVVGLVDVGSLGHSGPAIGGATVGEHSFPTEEPWFVG